LRIAEFCSVANVITAAFSAIGIDDPHTALICGKLMLVKSRCISKDFMRSTSSPSARERTEVRVTTMKFPAQPKNTLQIHNKLSLCPNPKYATQLAIYEKKQTLAEKLLWSKLRSRGLSGFKFRRQHPIDHYILDFYCHEIRLGIEIDGGHHAEGDIVEMDNQRTAYLTQKGV